MSIITGRMLNYFYKKLSEDIFAKKSIYGDTVVSMRRKSGTTVGERSFAFGWNTTASSNDSHAEGYCTEASGDFAHAEGSYTTASDACSHAEGNHTTASNMYSHAEGRYTTAGGYASHVEGDYTTAAGNTSHAEGYYTTALAYQHVQGHYNDSALALAGTEEGTGTGTAFCIGNGTSSAASNAVRIDYNGKIWCKKAYSSTGADYAELFEWADGNPDNEDRRGYFVTMDGDKIKKASKDDWILGIVSANPCILGNTDMEWQGQFLKDEFGDFIIEDGKDIVKEKAFKKDEDGNLILDEKGEPIEIEVEREVPYQFYKVNPDYDPNEEYIFRSDRKEWDAVGMLGVLAVRDNGTCQINGFCSCNDNGIAAASKTGYRVISRVNENIVKVIVK